jgi:hypothetical protein
MIYMSRELFVHKINGTQLKRLRILVITIIKQYKISIIKIVKIGASR